MGLLNLYIVREMVFALPGQKFIMAPARLFSIKRVSSAKRQQHQAYSPALVHGVKKDSLTLDNPQAGIFLRWLPGKSWWQSWLDLTHGLNGKKMATCVWIKCFPGCGKALPLMVSTSQVLRKKLIRSVPFSYTISRNEMERRIKAGLESCTFLLSSR